MRRWLLTALMLLLLSGCAYSRNYGCEGYPEGVNCMSARQVYQLTDNKEALTPNDMQNPKDKKDKNNNPPSPGQGSLINASFNAAPDPATAAVQGLGYEGPIPLRTSAQVMRIWLAPWESMDGVLHLPSYLYAEVVERKWSVGEAKMEIAPRITPLQVEAPVTPVAADAPGRSPRPQGKQPQRSPQPTPQKKSPGTVTRPPVAEKSKAIAPSAGFPRQW